MIDYKAQIKSLSTKQREVLDQICCENDAGHSIITLSSLVKKGLITRHIQVLSGGLITIDRYTYANLAVHMAWCELCAEECPNAI